MTFTTDIADNSAARTAPPGGLKPFFVRGLLLCLSATAAIGIYAVLTASFDETGARVLGSTLLAGLYCMFCLADVSVLDSRYRAVGTAGILTATAALAAGMYLIWAIGDDLPGDDWIFIGRGFLISAVVAFALAHTALLLRIDLAGSGAIAAVRAATLTIVGIVAILLCASVVESDLAEADGYWRLVGALAILDVLGTVSLPVLARVEARSAR